MCKQRNNRLPLIKRDMIDYCGWPRRRRDDEGIAFLQLFFSGQVRALRLTKQTHEVLLRWLAPLR